MFCKNCGKEIADGVSFCKECGAPVVAEQAANNQYAAPVEQYQYAGNAPLGGKLSQKGIAIIVGAAVAVVALVLVLIFALGGGSPESVAEDFVIAQLEYDADGMVDCMADCVLLEASEELGYKDEINKDKLVERLEKTYEEMEKLVGEDKMYLDYEIISVERDEDWDDAKDTFEDIEEDYGYKAANEIEEVCRVIVKAEVDGKDRSWKLIMVLEDGDWKVLD